MIRRTLSLLTIISLMGGIVSAQTFKYIGADKCKTCHNKPTTGDQYGQ